jgi:hypothetical protein
VITVDGAGYTGEAYYSKIQSTPGIKNANCCYDNVGNLTQGDGRTVAWTAFNMPSQILQNSRQINITYGPDRADDQPPAPCHLVFNPRTV